MLHRFLDEQEGQTTVEYLLIIAVIVVVISVLGKGMQTNVRQLVETVFSGITKKVSILMGAANGS